MIEMSEVECGYGASQVLFGINLSVHPGKIVTLMGRNGMGKTTTIRAIMGVLPLIRGNISFHGKRLNGLSTYRIAQMGIGVVPEGRCIFSRLTVLENLVATASNASNGKGNWNLERIFKLFPRLDERRSNYGDQLSGGEQQMLAIGRALMTNPSLLILDEATEGLAAILQIEIWRTIESLRHAGQSILIVDKNIKVLSKLADHHYIVEKGKIVWEGDGNDLSKDVRRVKQYIGI